MQITQTFVNFAESIKEIDHFLQQRYRRQQQAMIEATHKDYPTPTNVEPHSNIVRPALDANNIELKSSLLSMIQ